jgi:hypothetical protein
MSAEAKLKHLQFVQDYSKAASGAVTFAESVYSRAKSYTPSFAAPYVTKVEDTVVARAAPALATAADTAEKLLRAVDEQVGGALLGGKPGFFYANLGEGLRPATGCEGRLITCWWMPIAGGYCVPGGRKVAEYGAAAPDASDQHGDVQGSD